MTNTRTTDTIIIGAGPAGLSAAYYLSQKGQLVTVVEQLDKIGGISRTEVYKGYRFDLGGHRFFSKSSFVMNFWSELLGAEFLTRSRLSRIFYHSQFFSYPLRPFEILFRLGIWETTRIGLSYIKSVCRPKRKILSFEDWVVQHFGRRLFEIFFKTYTEKVWGMPCSSISSDWAAQRIKGLSPKAILMASLPRALRFSGNREVVKTLIEEFRYPRLGPGAMWEKCASKIEEHGSTLRLSEEVTSLRRLGDNTFEVVSVDANGSARTQRAQHVVSSMPLQRLIAIMTPEAPKAVLNSASLLRYRDFLIVVLILKDRSLFDDNWVYIHDEEVRVGRIQNFKNWSPSMVPDEDCSSIGMEYFCNRSDALWNMIDNELIKLAISELRRIGLDKGATVTDATVIRVPMAYPVYDEHYRDAVHQIRSYLEQFTPNLQVVGRNGMHRYNNQDHSVMTGYLAAQNILEGTTRYDIWSVNQDASYAEEIAKDEASPLPIAIGHT